MKGLSIGKIFSILLQVRQFAPHNPKNGSTFAYVSKTEIRIFTYDANVLDWVYTESRPASNLGSKGLSLNHAHVEYFKDELG